MKHPLPKSIVLSARFSRFTAWLVAFAITALSAVHTARAIELVNSQLPASETLQILTGSVTYEAEVQGTEGEVNAPYTYIVYVTGNDVYNNPYIYKSTPEALP